jgi:hypothetical protein
LFDSGVFDSLAFDPGVVDATGAVDPGVVDATGAVTRVVSFGPLVPAIGIPFDVRAIDVRGKISGSATTNLLDERINQCHQTMPSNNAEVLARYGCIGPGKDSPWAQVKSPTPRKEREKWGARRSLQ